jgi:hypothetical protein
LIPLLIYMMRVSNPVSGSVHALPLDRDGGVVGFWWFTKVRGIFMTPPPGD